MPLYIYFTVPFIKIFGLNEFAVRFSSAFFGSLTVLLVYYLAKELFIKNSNPPAGGPKLQNSKQLKKLQNSKILKNPHYSLLITHYLPPTAAVLLAISPWHLFYSRLAFEANLCLFLVLAGFVFFFLSFRKVWFLIFSALFWSLSFYTYSSAFIFLPPLVLTSLFLYKKEIFKKKRIMPVILAILTFVIGFGHSFYSVWKVSLAKKAITVFSDPTLVDKFHHLRTEYYARNPILARIWFNRFFYFGRISFVNYLKTFSPKFLFISGGGHPWHSIPNFGNFYLIETVFLILGIFVWKKLKGKSKWFLLSWLVLAPLASAITVDAPHSTRSLTLIIPMLILISLGIIQMFNFFKKKRQRIFIYCLLITVYSLLFTHFLYSYFCVYPRKLPGSLMYGLKEALVFVQNKNKDKKVVILNPPDSPYIYTLFHLKINPNQFLDSVKRYGAGVDNFEHVRSFDGFEFLYRVPEEKSGFYILHAENRLDESKVVRKIRDYKKDKTLFVVCEF